MCMYQQMTDIKWNHNTKTSKPTKATIQVSSNTCLYTQVKSFGYPCSQTHPLSFKFHCHIYIFKNVHFFYHHSNLWNDEWYILKWAPAHLVEFSKNREENTNGQQICCRLNAQLFNVCTANQNVYPMEFW